MTSTVVVPQLETQPPEWTRADWLAWRRQGVGGSDVAGLCGLSRFASPMSVFVDKLELGAPRQVGEAALWGNLLEEPIAREVEERTGLYVLHAQTLAVDGDALHRRCTLDGLMAETPGLALADRAAFLGTCQIKTSYERTWSDGIPDEYMVQVQWELGVTGYTHAFLPVLHAGQRLEIHEVDAQPILFATLCSIVDRFWHDHVLAGVQPPADGSHATRDALKAAFAESDGGEVEVDDQVVETAIAWRAAKAREKAAEQDVERLENQLRSALGEAAIGVYDGEPLITWKPQSTGLRIDPKALRADLPEIAAKYSKAGIARVLRKTKALDALIANLERADA